MSTLGEICLEALKDIENSKGKLSKDELKSSFGPLKNHIFDNLRPFTKVNSGGFMELREKGRWAIRINKVNFD